MSAEQRVAGPDAVPVLGLTGLLGGAAIITAVAAVSAAIASVHHVPAGAGALHVAGVELSYPRMDGSAALSLMLAALGTATLSRAARAAWRQRRAHRHFLAAVHVVGSLEGHNGVQVIAGRQPEAFCAGFWRPAVYVTEGTVDALAPDELSAVLEHERAHQRARDPLWIAAGRVLARAAFYLPILSALRDRYAELAELRADAAAVTAGARNALASALLAFQDAGRGGVGVSAARVDALLGESDRWQVPRRRLAASLVLLAAAAVGIWRSSADASLAATLNAPLLSSRPCAVLVLAALTSVVPAVVGLHRITLRRHLLRFVVDSRFHPPPDERTIPIADVAPLPSHRAGTRRPFGLAQAPRPPARRVPVHQ